MISELSSIAKRLEASALAENERERSLMLSAAKPEPSESVFAKEDAREPLMIYYNYNCSAKRERGGISCFFLETSSGIRAE